MAKSFLEKVGDIFVPAITTISRTVGFSSIANKAQEDLDKQYKSMTDQAIQLYRSGKVDQTKFKKISDLLNQRPNIQLQNEDIYKKDSQLIGEAIISGLTLAPIVTGALGMAGIGVKAPVTALVPKTVGRELLSRAATNVPTGAAFMGAQAIAAGKPAGEVMKEALRGGAWGAMLTPVTYGAEKATQALGKWLYSGLVKYSTNPKASTSILFTKKLVGTIDSINKRLNSEILIEEGKLKMVLDRPSILPTGAESVTIGNKTYVPKYTGEQRQLSSISPETYPDLMDQFTETFKIKGQGAVDKQMAEIGWKEFGVTTKITKDEMLNKAMNTRIKWEERLGTGEMFDETAYRKQLENSLKELGPYKLDELDISQAEAIRKKINSTFGDRNFFKKFQDLPELKKDLLNIRSALQESIIERVPTAEPIYQTMFPLECTRNSLSIMSNKVAKSMPLSSLEVGAIAGTIPNISYAPEVASFIIGRRVAMSGFPQSLGGGVSARMSQFINAAQTNPIMQKLFWRTVTEALKPQD